MVAAPPPGGEGGRRAVVMVTGGPSGRGGSNNVEGSRGGLEGRREESNHQAVAGLVLRASAAVVRRGGEPGGSVPMSSVWTSAPSAVVRVATLSGLLALDTPPGGGGGGGPPLVSSVSSSRRAVVSLCSETRSRICESVSAEMPCVRAASDTAMSSFSWLEELPHPGSLRSWRREPGESGLLPRPSQHARAGP